MAKGTALAFACWTGAAEAACRQALVLALDVSASVDAGEYRLQLDGLAAALEHPQVAQAAEQGPGHIRLHVFEWSREAGQRTLIGWTEITQSEDLARMAGQLRSVERASEGGATALGTALQHASRALEQQGTCWSQTVDVSADGKSNAGPLPETVDMGRATVNALVIGQDAQNGADRRQVELGELSSYFHAHVLRGPDAFVQVALGFADYERAMVAKLVRELEPGALSQRQMGGQHPSYARTGG